jgi:hypothetical protein
MGINGRHKSPRDPGRGPSGKPDEPKLGRPQVEYLAGSVERHYLPDYQIELLGVAHFFEIGRSESQAVADEAGGHPRRPADQHKGDDWLRRSK